MQECTALPAHINPDAYPSVTAMLEQAMARYAGHPAFTCLAPTLSYADIDRQSRAFAAYLQQTLGVKKGDRIAVMSPNFMAFPIAFLGIARAGAVQVNVNPMYTPRELEHQLNDAGVEVIIAYSGISATVAEVMPRTALKTVIIATPGDGTAVKMPSPPVDARLTSAVTLADALQAGAGLPFAPVALTGADLLFLQYTGGTTGLSKGAALSHRNVVANVEQFKAIMADCVVPGDEVIVTALPLYHIFALTVHFLSFFTVAAHNLLVAKPRHMDGVLHLTKAARPTSFLGVDTM